jgi:hypothetical protein
MTYSDRDPRRRWRRDPGLRLEDDAQVDPMLRTHPRRRGLWGLMAALAVILVLGIVFYGLNSQRPEGMQTTADRPNATVPGAPPSDVPPATRETTGERSGTGGSPAQNSSTDPGQGASAPAGAGQGGQATSRPPQGSWPQPANDAPERQQRP